MKRAKGAVFFFLMGLLGSCFNPPEFSIVPLIEPNSLVFSKGSAGNADSLILTINFKDGDGDLGLSSDQVDYPYQPVFYYLLNDGDTTRIPVYTKKVYDDLPPLINVDPGQTGLLITVRSQQPKLPPYVKPYNRTAYVYDSLYVSADDQFIFNNTYNLYKTLTNPTQPTIYVLLDTFYFETNPNHYNITVQFETQNNDGTYTEFDWREEFENQNFDGRFPILAESSVPLEGSLRYAMGSKGFLGVFGGKNLRLVVQIKDRALHLSNTITTSTIKIE